jgi:hypothetical protein
MSPEVVFAANMTVNVIGIGLIVLGLTLLVVTLAFWRAAVEDPGVLAPLEVMADRKYARADHAERAQILNQFRPEGAEVPELQNSSPSVLTREPLSEPERPFRDPYPHDDDAVDIVPAVIDPLLSQQDKSE